MHKPPPLWIQSSEDKFKSQTEFESPPSAASGMTLTRAVNMMQDQSTRVFLARSMLLHGLLTTLIGHLVAALSIAFCTSDLSHAIITGVLFAILGSFYLILEAPLVALALFVFRRLASLRSLVACAVAVIVFAAAVGRLLTIRVGGEHPSDYLVGYTIGGALLGACVAISGFFASKYWNAMSKANKSE